MDEVRNRRSSPDAGPGRSDPHQHPGDHPGLPDILLPRQIERGRPAVVFAWCATCNELRGWHRDARGRWVCRTCRSWRHDRPAASALEEFLTSWPYDGEGASGQRAPAAVERLRGTGPLPADPLNRPLAAVDDEEPRRRVRMENAVRDRRA